MHTNVKDKKNHADSALAAGQTLVTESSLSAAFVSLNPGYAGFAAAIAPSFSVLSVFTILTCWQNANTTLRDTIASIRGKNFRKNAVDKSILPALGLIGLMSGTTGAILVALLSLRLIGSPFMSPPLLFAIGFATGAGVDLICAKRLLTRKNHKSSASKFMSAGLKAVMFAAAVGGLIFATSLPRDAVIALLGAGAVAAAGLGVKAIWDNKTA